MRKLIVAINVQIKNGRDSYQTAITNRPFDVDKLDYTKRDSYTAGLALDFDIERLFTKIQIYTFSEKYESGK